MAGSRKRSGWRQAAAALPNVIRCARAKSECDRVDRGCREVIPVKVSAGVPATADVGPLPHAGQSRRGIHSNVSAGAEVAAPGSGSVTVTIDRARSRRQSRNPVTIDLCGIVDSKAGGRSENSAAPWA